jgi:NAD(P)-dependent dehydrogenase (short-subunit alcohol dehydrogenase family)
MSRLFEGEVAVITGGSSGIGRATALAFAREGASVAVASRRAEESEETVPGLAGSRIGSAYVASKHGVVGLTRAAALENAERGVRINAVAPAVIRTPMTDRAFFHDPAITAAVTGRHPMGRVGVPEEVANAVVWLCSTNASFTTGHTLPIDGGFLVP